MADKNYLFEDFASELLKINDFKTFIDDIISTDLRIENPEEELSNRLTDFESADESEQFICDTALLALALYSDREKFISYLEHYYDAATTYYNYWEYEYQEFGNGYQCFGLYNSCVLSLCIKYFESIKDKKKASISCLYLMCCLSYSQEPNPNDDLFKYYDMFEHLFNSLKIHIFPDWQTVHPSITRNIGKYYLEKRNYRKAREFFSIGASLDYDGRQSVEPFFKIGKNQYELGMTYYKGLGVKVNPKEALRCFYDAAENAGFNEIPVIQDMRLDGLIPIEISNQIDVLNNYGKFKSESDIDEMLDKYYVYYTRLNENQKSILKKCADEFIKENDLDFKELHYIYNVYKYSLCDPEKAKETGDRAIEFIETIPSNKRDSKMNEFYNEYLNNNRS